MQETVSFNGELSPGQPDYCKGNGKTLAEHGGGALYECCCDECGYYLECFTEKGERR